MNNFLVSNVDDDTEIRLDHYLSDKKNMTRSSVQSIIKSGLVLVNEKKIIKPSFSIKNGNTIKIINSVKSESKFSKLNIIYEDDFIFILEKPAGLIVHHGIKNQGGTLSDYIKILFPEIINVGDAGRNGIVHRLDKDTSGLIVVAKKNSSYIKMIELFKKRKVEKNYLALIHGHLNKKTGTIIAPIGRNPKNRTKQTLISSGKQSITSYKLIKEYEKETLVLVSLKTGRMHQIRVHFSSIGHPIVGDKKYGKKNMENNLLKRHFLHANKLKFKHPIEEKILSFSSHLPNDLSRYLENLNA